MNGPDSRICSSMNLFFSRRALSLGDMEILLFFDKKRHKKCRHLNKVPGINLC